MSPHRTNCRAVTLIEMMVALVVTLIMMAAVVSIFALASGNVNNGRTMMEMADRIRSAQHRLKLDLAGVTAPTYPWLRPEAGYGYFEVVEGPLKDSDFATTPNTSMLGDTDDILAFTTRSSEGPFVDASSQNQPQSQVAEVVWFCVKDPNSTAETRYNLFRKVRLVGPSGTGTNNLGELTKRENRWMRNNSSVSPIDRGQLDGSASSSDLVLTNVVGFDVRVWDPLAPIMEVKAAVATDPSVAAGPSDSGYNPAGTAIGMGAWVDLGYKANGTGPNKPPFSGTPAPESKITTPTWDTWPASYEYSTPDTNGLEDVTKRVSSPPYPTALRGVQVIIRVYEPDSRQTRQVTVVEQFLPD